MVGLRWGWSVGVQDGQSVFVRIGRRLGKVGQHWGGNGQSPLGLVGRRSRGSGQSSRGSVGIQDSQSMFVRIDRRLRNVVQR
ncbi:hypothetical protein L484_018498 [Morus notabilis]|uniref:Uncharacterized protein n=1 Tax=Morus notabilis TaxID=981085 RepID=W9SSH6_9ROSA|nr:hypothetical protein L484_018498 [Morus notabilis]